MDNARRICPYQKQSWGRAIAPFQKIEDTFQGEEKEDGIVDVLYNCLCRRILYFFL